MRRKGQVVVLRELFSFAIGVVVMLSVVTIFNTSVSPQLKEYSVNEQSYSMLYHFHSLFEKSLTLARTDDGAAISIQETLPNEIAEQSYRIYVSNSELCIRTKGDVSIIRCINTTVPAVISGNFLSGSELMLNSSVTESGMSISFGNYIPSYLPGSVEILS